MQRFKEISEKKGLLRDNDTRWNSKYYMTARTFELADQIDYFCSKEGERLEAGLTLGARAGLS